MTSFVSLPNYGTMIGTAFSHAWKHMTVILFRQFSWGRWLTLAFAAWLAQLGAGGGSFTYTQNLNFGSGGDQFADAANWIENHLQVVIMLGLAVVVLVFFWWLLCLWLGARGKFIFLHDVVQNVTKIKEPWFQFRSLGNSLFSWLLVFSLVVFLVLGIIGGTTALMAVIVRDTQPALFMTIFCGGLLFLCAALTTGIIGVMLKAFVVPIMYRYNMRTREAWAYVLALMRPHWKGFLLFMIARLAVGMLVGIFTVTVVWLVILMTCCTAGIVMMIPVVGGVFSIALILPAPVFMRLFSVYFLQQFHHDYQMTVPWS